MHTLTLCASQPESGQVMILNTNGCRYCSSSTDFFCAGEGNPHHYFVASQDPELRRELRGVAGVPLLHIIRNTIVLEKPTQTSQHKAEEVGTL